MTTLCDTIDTLAMVYLDHELDVAERRELELHLHSCTACRDHIAAKRDSRVKLRALLAPPPVPSSVRARIESGLDTEEKRWVKHRRSALVHRALPTIAVAAAAAALAVFFFTPSQSSSPTHEAIRSAIDLPSSRPLEVQGPSTSAWLARNFQTDVAVPAFDGSSVRQIGASRTRITNHDVPEIFYEVVSGPNRFALSVLAFSTVRPGELRGHKRVVVNGIELWVSTVDRPAGQMSIVSYEDGHGRGYVFRSTAFSPQALLDVVVMSNGLRPR